jgi:hypothetical protein
MPATSAKQRTLLVAEARVIHGAHLDRRPQAPLRSHDLLGMLVGVFSIVVVMTALRVLQSQPREAD